MSKSGRPGLKRLRLGLFLGVGLAAAAIALAADAAGILRSQEQSTVDVRFSLRGPHGTPSDVAIVAIDDVTFNALDTRWPFQRRLHARVIDRLRQAGAKVIAYDIQFTERTDDFDDNALIDSIGRARNVVLAATEVDDHGRTKVLGGDDVVRAFHAAVGDSLFPNDSGGTIRKLPLEVDGLKGFAITAAERATGRTITHSGMGGSTAWIDYVGPPGTVPAVSFSRVLAGQFPRDSFRGKVVVVGPTAPSQQDLHATSVSGGELMSGAELQANAIWTALHGFPLRSAPGAINVLLIILMALIAPLASVRLSAFRTLGVAVAAGAVFAVGVQFAFDRGRVVAFVLPLVALGVSTLGAVAVSSVLAAFEREHIRDLFGRFVPESVVDEVLSQAQDGLHLGGKLRVCTMMFTDLRGFTTFSESRSAEEVIDVLNHFFGEVSQAVLDHGGTLLAYLGDGLMAVFGAPIDQEDHADRAVAAAREILVDRLPRVNEWLRAQGYGEGFRMGIGLNSGTLMVGNIGSEQRMEYTTIGDAVNTASRLEGMTKGTPFPLFISKATHELLRQPPEDLIYIAELEVRGRSERVQVWSLEGVTAPRQVPEAEAPEPGLAVPSPT